MRIAGGRDRGRKLKVPSRGIRPTKALVRKAIFDIIGSDIKGAEILDIFAGSGALGIEALSRGAKSCVFVDNMTRPLLENIKRILGPNRQTKVIKRDFRIALKILKGYRFDIIFADPPYAKDYLEIAIRLICRQELLKDSGMVVVEHHPTKKIILPETLVNFKQRKYGAAMVSFLTRQKTEGEESFHAPKEVK